jgi:streptogramin lyase
VSTEPGEIQARRLAAFALAVAATCVLVGRVVSVARADSFGTVTKYADPTRIKEPKGIVVGPDGALWFTNDGDDSIGRISTGGKVTHYSDPSIRDPWGIASGPDGAMWFINTGSDSIGRITTTGTVTNYTDPGISAPPGIVAGPDDALWFISQGGPRASPSIERITASGIVTHFTQALQPRRGPLARSIAPENVRCCFHEILSCVVQRHLRTREFCFGSPGSLSSSQASTPRSATKRHCL